MKLREIRKISIDDKWENEDPACVYKTTTIGCGCFEETHEVDLRSAIYLIESLIRSWQDQLEPLKKEWQDGPRRSDENKEECATRKGCKTFDCALPQPWLGLVTAGACTFGCQVGSDEWNETYQQILFGTVWCYDKNRILGKAFFLTSEAENLARLAGLRDDRDYTA